MQYQILHRSGFPGSQHHLKNLKIMVAETCRYLANVSRNPGLLDFLWAVSPSAPTLHNLKKIIFYGYLCILI